MTKNHKVQASICPRHGQVVTDMPPFAHGQVISDVPHFAMGKSSVTCLILPTGKSSVMCLILPMESWTSHHWHASFCPRANHQWPASFCRRASVHWSIGTPQLDHVHVFFDTVTSLSLAVGSFYWYIGDLQRIGGGELSLVQWQASIWPWASLQYHSDKAQFHWYIIGKPSVCHVRELSLINW